jgi:nicotinamide mononucleotide transporter
MEALNQTLFTLWGYPLSVLELVGVLTGFAAVFLASKAWAVNFLFGMVNAVAYFLLYFDYHLYSMMTLQIAYFSFSVYGFYHWKHPKDQDADLKKEQRIGYLTHKTKLIWLVCIVVAAVIWGWGVIHLQARFPDHFEPPLYPWLDAFLTMASLVAQYLLSRKVWENWVLWIVIDATSTVLYASVGMVFTAFLYGVFTLIAVKAMFEWKKIYETYK